MGPKVLSTSLLALVALGLAVGLAAAAPRDIHEQPSSADSSTDSSSDSSTALLEPQEPQSTTGGWKKAIAVQAKLGS